MSLKTQAAKRRNSYIEIESNPLESGKQTESVSIECLGDAKPISSEEFTPFLATIKSISNNDAKVKTISTSKKKYLFASNQLIDILNTTPSIKTQIAIITHLGPRLTDPKSRSEDILNRFRFSEEKRVVEEILRMRTQTLAASMYSSAVNISATTNRKSEILLRGNRNRVSKVKTLPAAISGTAACPEANTTASSVDNGVISTPIASVDDTLKLRSQSAPPIPGVVPTSNAESAVSTTETAPEDDVIVSHHVAFDKNPTTSASTTDSTVENALQPERQAEMNSKLNSLPAADSAVIAENTVSGESITTAEAAIVASDHIEESIITDSTEPSRDATLHSDESQEKVMDRSHDNATSSAADINDDAIINIAGVENAAAAVEESQKEEDLTPSVIPVTTAVATTAESQFIDHSTVDMTESNGKRDVTPTESTANDSGVSNSIDTTEECQPEDLSPISVSTITPAKSGDANPAPEVVVPRDDASHSAPTSPDTCNLDDLRSGAGIVTTDSIIAIEEEKRESFFTRVMSKVFGKK